MPPARPSKRVLFALLEGDLAAITGGTGVDAASANMKNRPLFRTDRYVGVDLSTAELEAGLSLHPGATGIVADLSAQELPSGFARVCVSTNTFYYLSPAGRLHASQTLTRALEPGGTLLIHAPRADGYQHLLTWLQGAFERVDVVRTRNVLSIAYERLMERGGRFDEHPRSLALRTLARGLALLERLACRLPLGQRDVYLRCTGKRGGGTRPLELNALERVGERLYRAR
jgi:SAM-dependent methyltransferase